MLCLQGNMCHVSRHATKSKPILSRVKSAAIMSKVGRIDYGQLDKVFCLGWRFGCGVCGLSNYFLAG